MKYILLTLLSISLCACSNPRKSLGLTNKAPDEFKVVKNAPLEMPSSYTLPPPRPGAPRPQERAVTDQVKQSLLGQNATQSNTPTQAEALLLQQAGAANAKSDIRTVIDSEKGRVNESNQSVAKRLLGIGGESEEAAVLNAQEEAERLKNMQTQNNP